MKIALLVFAFVVSGLPVAATTIEVVATPTETNTSPYGVPLLNVPNPDPSGNPPVFFVRVGQLAVSINSQPSVIMYCLDLLTGIETNVVYQSTQHLPLTAAEQRVAWLYVNYGFAYTGAPAQAVDTDVEGVALQLAIWDIIHDGGTGPNSGNFIMTLDPRPGVKAKWQEYLDLSVGQSSLAAYVYVNTTDGNVPAQTLIGPGPAIPEPSTLGLLLSGGIALAAWKRHRRVQ